MEKGNIISDNEMKEHLDFYINSLKVAENNINNQNQKALKDVVGNEFEKHRKRIWEHFGFIVSKKYNIDLPFNPDWIICDKDNNLVLIEEDKGHYLDSCFMDRTLISFAKTINLFLKQNRNMPLFLIYSFTKYNLFEIKKNTEIEVFKNEIQDIMVNKVLYKTLTNTDRLPKQKWFCHYKNCFTENLNVELIVDDINFIISLIK